MNGGTPIAPWRIHDLRRTFATGLARLGVQLPVVEKLLNHTSGSFAGIVGVYQRHNFSEEKRHALERWGAHVADLVADRRSQNVVESGLKSRVERFEVSPEWMRFAEAMERAGSLEALAAAPARGEHPGAP